MPIHPHHFRMKRCFSAAEVITRVDLTLRPADRHRGIVKSVAFIVFAMVCVPSVLKAEEVAKVEAKAVVDHYQKIVSASYQDALSATEVLRSQIDEFIAAPDENRLATVRKAWIAAHVAYSVTEAYRFYDGPIDNNLTGVETRINGWPMDEAYVDGVLEKPQSGIINDPEHYPWLDTTSLAEVNTRGGDKNIATGYHAIEFLLWGQDTNPDGPGTRPWQDFLVGGDAAPNPERRVKYLKSIADLLIQDLGKVHTAWDPQDPASYAKEFLLNADGSSLAKIFTGIGRLAGDELAGERMFVAYDTGDQENEQSCFSDTTLLALIENADGIRNVYLGTYHDLKGPSLSDLVRQVDPAADAAVKKAIDKSRQALAAIPAPLDRVITAKQDDPARQKLLDAVDAMEQEGETIIKAAAALGITLNLNVGGKDAAR